MTGNTDEPTEGAVHLNDETLADLDAQADPAGGRAPIGGPMLSAQQEGHGGCKTDDDYTCGQTCSQDRQGCV